MRTCVCLAIATWMIRQPFVGSFEVAVLSLGVLLAVVTDVAEVVRFIRKGA